jgi:protein-tyrosine phosphatase
MHLIWTHPNGARLYQSGDKAGFDAPTYGVQAVALLADWQPETLPGGVRPIHAPFADSDDMAPDEFERTKLTARAVAQELAACLERGENVLASCGAGLNRSGLVSALVLVKFGMKAGQAIETVREKRSPYALTNRLFQKIVRLEGLVT